MEETTEKPPSPPSVTPPSVTPKPVLQSGAPVPPQSTSPPGHATSVPPEKPVAVQAPTDETRSPAMVTFLPTHPTSPYDLTAVEEEEEEIGRASCRERV